MLMKMNPAKTILARRSPVNRNKHYEKPKRYKLTVEGSHGGQAYRWGYAALYDGMPIRFMAEAMLTP